MADRDSVALGSSTNPQQCGEACPSSSVAAAATALDSSKIKAFLYQQEPNMAKLKPAPLQLISTTTGLFVKSIVDASKGVVVTRARLHSSEATRSGGGDGKQKRPKEQTPPAIRSSKRTRNTSVFTDAASSKSSEAIPLPDPPLITLDILQQAVSTDPSLQFLQESLNSIQDETLGSSCPYHASKHAKRQRRPNSSTRKATKDSVVSGTLAPVEKKLGRGRRKSNQQSDSSKMSSTLQLDTAQAIAAASTPGVSSTNNTASLTSGLDGAAFVENNGNNFAQGSDEILVDDEDYD